MRNYVYIAECADGTWYTGWTTDVAARMRTHNRGEGARYTRSRLPVHPVFVQAFVSKEEAMRREYAIKQMTRQEKERFAAENRPPGTRDGFMGKIYYLMGKSATGKDHIYERLLEDQRLGALPLRPLVIYTTRPMRAGETQGVEYHFTDTEGLARLEAAGRVVEQRAYDTVQGVWHYFTVDDENLDLTRASYLAIGTLASYKKIRKYYGPGNVAGLYIRAEDGLRLERAILRERKQAVPQYEEMCRRFLADQKDFAPEKLDKAGIDARFDNDGALEETVEKIVRFILEDAGVHA